MWILLVLAAICFVCASLNNLNLWKFSLSDFFLSVALYSQTRADADVDVVQQQIQLKNQWREKISVKQCQLTLAHSHTETQIRKKHEYDRQ